jgi:hypothetical protein
MLVYPEVVVVIDMKQLKPAQWTCVFGRHPLGNACVADDMTACQLNRYFGIAIHGRGAVRA